jgi:peroxiredoxin
MKNQNPKKVNRMIQKLAFAFILGISIFTVTSCSSSDDSSETAPVSNPPPSSTNKAPDFSLTSSDGNTVKLSDYSGKVVVLFFFGNSCPSCRTAAPSIQSKLATPYASNSNYQIIGIDQWDGNAASVQSFKSTTGVTFPLLLNGSGTTAAYKTTYDRLVVIDKSGNISFSGTKLAGSDADAAKLKVDELLK